MPEWTSKKQVEDALRRARKHFKAIHLRYATDSPEYLEAQKKCVELQRVLDSMRGSNARYTSN